MQLFINNFGRNITITLDNHVTIDALKEKISSIIKIPQNVYYLRYQQYVLDSNHGKNTITTFNMKEDDIIYVSYRIKGGIDFQHREGSKTGSGGQLSESQAAIERRERLRKLALETIDITKDPYIMRNHLGTFECKLCLTLHPNEGNYLAHTQGKRHQSNLGRRAAMDARNAPSRPLVMKEIIPKQRSMKIGRPGYKVTKSRDLITRQRSLLFDIDYPEAEKGLQPRHRFMSSFEQKIETPDKNFQYLLFACEPYETIAFKIPNHTIDRRPGRFFTNWDAANNKFVLQLFFMDDMKEKIEGDDEDDM